ncbi:hypothetical protein TNCV_1705031 [Trichonephila clavipes]|nr:hypothetical protein TNCV_1705031 [Trichonephila clavipes]
MNPQPSNMVTRQKCDHLFPETFTCSYVDIRYSSDPQPAVHGPVSVCGSNGAGPPKEHQMIAILFKVVQRIDGATTAARR